jgi:hypothetical protein
LLTDVTDGAVGIVTVEEADDVVSPDELLAPTVA